MRKVELRMKEELKYLTIKKLVETNGSKKKEQQLSLIVLLEYKQDDCRLQT